MAQKNFMNARALTMEEMENVNGGIPSLENVNGGIPSLMRQILKKTRSDYEAKAI